MGFKQAERCALLVFFCAAVAGFTSEFGADSTAVTDPAAKKTEASTAKKEPETPPEIDDNFASIHRGGLTAAYGGSWFFEQFDKQGNKTMTVFYEKDKLLEKKTYVYRDGKRTAAEITLPDRVVSIRYDADGRELERTVYDEKKEEIIEKTVNVYKSGLLAETSVEKDGEVKSSEFTYSAAGEKKTREDFTDGKRTALIEYGKDKRTVHLFESGREISVFEETVLNDKE